LVLGGSSLTQSPGPSERPVTEPAITLFHDDVSCAGTAMWEVDIAMLEVDIAYNQAAHFSFEVNLRCCCRSEGQSANKATWLLETAKPKKGVSKPPSRCQLIPL